MRTMNIYHRARGGNFESADLVHSVEIEDSFDAADEAMQAFKRLGSHEFNPRNLFWLWADSSWKPAALRKETIETQDVGVEGVSFNAVVEF